MLSYFHAYLAQNSVDSDETAITLVIVKKPETLSRELAPFDKIGDHNEKILISADYETGSRNGVKQINVVDWLFGEE